MVDNINNTKRKSRIWFISIVLALSAISINTLANEVSNISKRVPAEWETQEAIWMQWPGYWEKEYEPTFAKISAIISRYEKLHILYHSEKIYAEAHKAINKIGADPQNKNIRWHKVPNDNAWMRDNGPIYVLEDNELSLILIRRCRRTSTV